MLRTIPAMILLTFFSLVGAANADILNPSGLSPGDEYRIAFVTSSLTAASNSDIAFYNALVAAQAAVGSETSKVSTTWSVIGSTLTMNAIANTATDPSPAGANGVPIFLVDGTTLIADHYDDFWDGSLDSALSLDQNGAVVTNAVYTGTTATGATIADRELGSTAFFVGTGVSNQSSGWWIQFDNSFHTAGESVYGLSGVLQVAAVPEPSSVLLIISLGAGTALICRRRQPN